MINTTDCSEGKICMENQPMVDCPKGYYCPKGTGYLPFDLNILND
jgi:hypothetical protein